MKIIVVGQATVEIPSPLSLLHSVMRRWQSRMARLCDPYRPELHYMRGPGPRSREKLGLSERAL